MFSCTWGKWSDFWSVNITSFALTATFLHQTCQPIVLSAFHVHGSERKHCCETTRIKVLCEAKVNSYFAKWSLSSPKLQSLGPIAFPPSRNHMPGPLRDPLRLAWSKGRPSLNVLACVLHHASTEAEDQTCCCMRCATITTSVLFIKL